MNDDKIREAGLLALKASFELNDVSRQKDSDIQHMHLGAGLLYLRKALDLAVAYDEELRRTEVGES